MTNEQEVQPIVQNFNKNLAERVQEKPVAAVNGFLMLFLGLAGLVASVLLLIFGVGPESPDMPNSWVMIAAAIEIGRASCRARV